MPRVVWDVVRFDHHSGFNTSGVITLSQWRPRTTKIALLLRNCCQLCLLVGCGVHSGKFHSLGIL